jgi:hypothetical protein
MNRVLLMCLAVLAAATAAGAKTGDASRRAHHMMPGIPGPERLLEEGFNDQGTFPPAGWTQIVNNSVTWEQASDTPQEGCCYATCYYDSTYSGPQDERICIDYTIEPGDDCLCFYASAGTHWAIDPYQNYNIAVTIDGSTVWDYYDDNDSATSWNWQLYCVDLSTYPVGQEIEICFVYEGYDGAQGSFDAVWVGPCPEIPEECCPLQADPCFAVDFDEAVDYTIEDCGGTSNPWAVGLAGEIPGLNCTHADVGQVLGTDLGANYDADTGGRVALGPFAISEGCDCMELCHFYDTESGYDGGNVKVSTDGGSTWQLVTPDDGYDDILGSSSYVAACVPGEEVFTGHASQFVYDCFDLSAYDGENVMIGFFFGSDESVSYRGWYIDTIRIGGGQTSVQPASWGSIKAMYR